MTRSVAQEAVSWYFTHIDELQPHTFNVQTVLRGPVIALTASILSSSSASTGEGRPGTPPPPPSSTGTNGSNPSATGGAAAEIESSEKGVNDENVPPSAANWREYLIGESELADKATENFHLKDAVAVYSSLSPRAQARLEAFLDGVALAIEASPPEIGEAEGIDRPSKTVSERQPSFGLIEGLAGFRSLEKSSSSGVSAQSGQSSGDAKKKRGKPKKFIQIPETDLLLRLELYIRTLQRSVHLHRDCVVSAESNRAIKARAQFVVVAFVDTVGTVRQQSPVLTRLLQALTRELLAVPVLSEHLVRSIRRIVSTYVQTTSFASLAFLSSPETAAETRLKPSVLKYLKYLQQNWQHCEVECDLERMLSTCIDPEVRKTFKTVEFQSIGHLLEVCQGFRSELRNIVLPPLSIYNANSSKVDDGKVRQALRDLQREVITVNGHVLPPVSSRTDLITLLSQTLNSRALANPAEFAAKMSKKKKKKKKRKGSRRIDESGSETDEKGATSSEDTDKYFTETDLSGTDTGATAAQHATARNRSFRLSTVDLLTKRLLLAAGRTGTGGDAYFVVRDLFGGDGVEVVPSKSNAFFNSYYRPLSSAGTIDLLVKLTSVTIKCHASFDVYPKNMVGDTEPLIQVHTTTSETIELQEVRLSDLPASERNLANVPALPPHQNPHPHEDTYTSDEGAAGVEALPASAIGSTMVVQERKTERSGFRTLTVRPALYEKVEVFNTPS